MGVRERRDAVMERRHFLRFLAGSPLLAQGAVGAAMAALARRASAETPGFPSLIESPGEALSVFDFEAVAARTVPPAHFGFLQTGVDGETTLRANRSAFEALYLRPRVLAGSPQVDTRTELFGQSWETPIVLAPAGSQRAFHPEGELASARAAGKQRNLQILSTVSTSSIEDVNAAYGAPVWYQLYPTSSWEIAERLVGRAEAAGCPVLVLTVDSLAGEGTKESQARAKPLDSRPCVACHASPDAYLSRKPMFDGLDVSAANPALGWGANLGWDFVRRLKASTSMKLVIKGIVTAGDAERCLENGADAIIVSNHGGRAVETGRGTIECLPEVVAAVAGQAPVLIDSGFRRGTDVFKALALGARAVCIGRPYLWGLGAFGQPGVEAVLALLRAELEVVMRQAGTPSLAEISAASIGRR
ncbi:MAG: alpha-hydroxy-acid oxidizing protein [Myxococcales bacterium]|nr:alpha-hydroxy-acid oxidizing protein [Myxococcales bacterium]